MRISPFWGVHGPRVALEPMIIHWNSWCFCNPATTYVFSGICRNYINSWFSMNSIRNHEKLWKWLNVTFSVNLHPSPRLGFPKGMMAFLLRGGPENWKSQLFGENTWESLKCYIIAVKQQRNIEMMEMCTFPCFRSALVAPCRKHQYSLRNIDGSGSVPGPPNRDKAPKMQIFTKVHASYDFRGILWNLS